MLKALEEHHHAGFQTELKPPSEKALQIRGLGKSFGAFTALENIDLDIERGELVCFLGPSGCGKTTLLRAIAGLEPQNHGTIHQNGRDISRVPVGRRDFGIVFQSYALFPNLTIEKNIGYGLYGQGHSRTDRAARINELLDLVGLRNQAGKYPAQLSGGQQQRVALARALAPSPGLLLLDEPLSALDAKVRLHLRDELRQLQRRLGVTTIMVTHDQDEALAIADRIVVMNQGVIEQVGSAEEVFSAPSSPFVAGFLGDMNFISAIAEGPASVLVGDQAFPIGNQFARNEPISLCIRPADFVIDGQGTDHPVRLQARVKTISFRGNFYRLALSCDVISQFLEMEIPRSSWSDFDIAEGSMIMISCPSDKLIIFPRGG